MKNTDYGPIKTVYYTDERNDEFSAPVIQAKTIGEAYDYTPGGLGWKIRRFLAYRVIAMPIAWAYCKIVLHSSFRNRAALKQVPGGCFVYANHTQQTADAFIPNLALFPRDVYMVVHPDNVSMPFLGRVTPYLGALPLPSNLKAMRHFKEALKTRIGQGACVMVYPEAHIWPYYTGIRDFPATSMKYPVELKVPSFTLTTTYHRRRFGRKPRAVTWLEGPFYPDESLPPRQQPVELRNRIYETMKARSRDSDYEYIRYVKKEAESP